jgi:hypothetical protein
MMSEVSEWLMDGTMYINELRLKVTLLRICVRKLYNPLSDSFQNLFPCLCYPLYNSQNKIVIDLDRHQREIFWVGINSCLRTSDDGGGLDKCLTRLWRYLLFCFVSELFCNSFQNSDRIVSLSFEDCDKLGQGFRYASMEVRRIFMTYTT